MTNVLQYVKMLSAEDFTKEDITNCQYVGQVSCARTLYIFQLKQALQGSSISNYSGIKLHAIINHIHQQIFMFGSPKWIDTVPFEHQHAVDGVAAAALTAFLTAELLITVSF